MIDYATFLEKKMNNLVDAEKYLKTALKLTNNGITNFEMGKDETQFASNSTKKIYHDIKRKLNDLNAKNVKSIKNVKNVKNLKNLNLKKENSNINNNTANNNNSNNNKNGMIGHDKTETISNSNINNKSSAIIIINKTDANSDDIGETETNICTSIATKNTNSKVTDKQSNDSTAGDDVTGHDMSDHGMTDHKVTIAISVIVNDKEDIKRKNEKEKAKEKEFSIIKVDLLTEDFVLFWQLPYFESTKNKYLPKFVSNEWNCISMIKFMTSDTLINDIGMNSVHSRLFQDYASRIKNENKKFSQWFDSFEFLTEYALVLAKLGVYSFTSFHRRFKNEKILINAIKVPSNSDVVDDDCHEIWQNTAHYKRMQTINEETNGDHHHYTKQEYIYVKQYFNLRNGLYSNIFGNNSEENKQISHSAPKLNNHNCFLLHGVCYLGYHEYCKILIEDGFDMKQRNRLLCGETPYEIAQRCNHENILFLFGSLNNNNNSIMKSTQDYV